MEEISYYIVGIRPVKMVPNEEGGLGIFAYNWQTGEFDRAMEYLTQIHFGKGDIEKVSEEDFEKQVEELRAKLKKPKE
jgi:hypothetical protein